MHPQYHPIKSPKRPRDLDSPDSVQVIPDSQPAPKSQKQIRLRAPKPSGIDSSRWKITILGDPGAVSRGRAKCCDERFQERAQEPLGTKSHRTISKRLREYRLILKQSEFEGPSPKEYHIKLPCGTKLCMAS